MNEVLENKRRYKDVLDDGVLYGVSVEGGVIRFIIHLPRITTWKDYIPNRNILIVLLVIVFGITLRKLNDLTGLALVLVPKGIQVPLR